MSETSLSPNTTVVPMPSGVRQLISGLRVQLRKYAVLSGLLYVLISAILVFWITSGIDAGWFTLQRLELPVGFRNIILAAMLASGTWLLVFNVLKPMFRRIRDREVALLLEKYFPQFQDRLITTVEAQHGYPGAGQLVDGMLQRTADQAAELATAVVPRQVFNPGQIRKRSAIAVILILSVAISTVARPGSLQRWWNAFVLRSDIYHLRTTAVNFSILAQPGNRRLDFKEIDEVPRYLHPRGADLEFEMMVPDALSPAGQPWIVPERVRVDVIRADGSRSRTYVSSTTDRSFRFILTRLQEDVRLEVLAGDYRTPVPLQVKSVTPPGINGVQVRCDFPEYTGWNGTRDAVMSVMGSEISLPLGTKFRLEAVSNKPLVSARIVTDLFELSGDRSSLKFMARDGVPTVAGQQAPLLSADGLLLTAGFHLTSEIANIASTSSSSDLPGDAAGKTKMDESAEQSAGEIRIPSNTSLRFVLHDEDDILSSAPESLRIRGLPDVSPAIAIRMTGVGNAITRRATIPIEGRIVDDYGLVSAGFQFLVDDETQWRPRPFRRSPDKGVAEFLLGKEAGSQAEQFQVQPLDLSEGQTLALAVSAADGCTLPGPNTSRSEPTVFRIVSNEELLSLLYARELSLRRRFEEVIQQLDQINEDLVFHQTVSDRIDASPASARPEDRIALTTCSTRSGDSLRRQSNEMESIVQGFDEIIQQLINNAIPPQQLAKKMETDIVAPMNAVTSRMMVQADRSLSRLRVAATSGESASELVKESVRDVSAVITELRRILENVRDMAELHEALSDLKSILDEQQRILEETRAQSKKRALEKLKLTE